MQTLEVALRAGERCGRVEEGYKETKPPTGFLKKRLTPIVLHLPLKAP